MFLLGIIFFTQGKIAKAQYMEEYIGQPPAPPGCGACYGGEYSGEYGSEYPGQYGSEYGSQYGGEYGGEYGSEYGSQYGSEYGSQGSYSTQYDTQYVDQYIIQTIYWEYQEPAPYDTEIYGQQGYVVEGYVAEYPFEGGYFVEYGSESGPTPTPGGLPTPTPTGVLTPTPTNVPGTNKISGVVYVDTNSNGAKDIGEAGYSGGATISLDLGSTTTNSSGDYGFIGVPGGGHTITLTVPSGYTATTATSFGITTPPDGSANFGIVSSATPPSCPGGVVPGSSSIGPGGTTGVSVGIVGGDCTGITPPVPTPFVWPPSSPQCSDGVDNDADSLIDINDPGCHTDGDASNASSYLPSDNSESSGSTTCSDGGISNISSNSTSSTATWNAPSCSTTPLVCSVGVNVSGPSGTTSYAANINVASSYTITTNVREVADSAGSCDPSVGSAYSGATINISGGSINQNVTSNGTGQSISTCLPANSYTATIGNITGYDIVGKNPSGGGFANTISTSVGPSKTLTFCILRTATWYQTDFGDVRYRDLDNPVPSGYYGSIDTTYPGIYYSSTTNSTLGGGSISPQGWVVNDEYSFNANTKNKNGTLAYSFYKSKARQDGTTVVPLSSDLSQITGSGVYEYTGNLTISSYSHVSGSKVVILVSGTTTITTPISISVGDGFLIVASKGDLTFDRSVGTTTLNSTTSNLDGYYTSEGDVILDGVNSCPTLDKRLNIGGAVIANAAKPFASNPTGGKIVNNRTLCSSSLTYPTLYVSTRTDFLTKLTDFYKTSYTKWKEVRP